MANIGICPKCETTISSVKIEAVELKENFNNKWEGMSYLCPSCNTVLSVDLNPFHRHDELIDEIKKK